MSVTGFKARIKFKDGLPFKLQKHITDKYGFVFEERIFQKHIILRKPIKLIMGHAPARGTMSPPLVTSGSLTSNDKIELARKCMAIKANFHDPSTSAAIIRFRIGEMARPLNKEQKNFCQEWVERNIDAL